MKKQRERPSSQPMIVVRLSNHERSLLVQDPVIPDELTQRLRFAVVEGDGVEVAFTLDELEELIAYVGAEAGYSTSAKREREFEAIYAKLREAEEDFFKSLPDGTTPEDLYGQGGREKVLEEAEMFLDSLPPELADEIREIMQSGEFANRDEFEERVLDTIAAFAHRSLAMLGGLSPSQMEDLVDGDWLETGTPISLNRELSLEEVSRARFTGNACVLLSVLEKSGGVKATATGNLTRKFVAEMMERMEFPEGYLDLIRGVCKVINEEDVQPLHLVRVVLQQGGFIRKYKGKFVITRAGKALLPDEAAGELYARVFDAFFRKFNLASIDGMIEFTGFQATVPYVLWRLREAAEDWRPAEDLAEEVLLAQMREEIADYYSPDRAHWPLETRVLRPLVEFGLLEERTIPPDAEPGFGTDEYRKTDLYDRFFKFKLDAEA